MLKLSSNPHTAQFPYLVGAIAGHHRENAQKTGQEFQRRLFEKAGVDPAGRKTAGNSVLEPGGDRYSPDAFIQFLTYMSGQPYFARYLQALPVMGKDGSLAKVQATSPAAGHVYAKTGTGLSMRMPAGTAGPAKNAMHVSKALAGYMELPDGRLIVFAEFLELEDQRGPQGVEPLNQVMGEIASVVYESLVSRPN
jgi:D-alanyl-D-alanine carboxypeptidase/D-alanyl-D-alanine-endopeptidase (penicillin-binding protein 4)